MEQYKIYSLIDPITDEVRYIGKTVSLLPKRLSSHYRDKKHSHKTHWINSLKEKGLKPIIKLIENCGENNWQEKEKFWIQHYRKIGGLTNYLDGGQGQQKGYKHTSEAKLKISLASKKNIKGKFVKNHKFSEITNKKRSDSLKKSVYQLDENGLIIKEWSGITDASVYLNIDKNSIQSSLKKRSVKAGGFIWCYKDDYINFKPKINQKEKEIKVVENDVILTFKSIKEASIYYGIDRKHIDYAIKYLKPYNNKFFKRNENSSIR